MRESEHDKKVRKIAAAYWGMGHDVHADLPDYELPTPIRGKIPDIVVKSGKTTMIIEVETPESFDRDRDQRAVFRDYAYRKSRTTFRWTVTD